MLHRGLGHQLQLRTPLGHKRFTLQFLKGQRAMADSSSRKRKAQHISQSTAAASDRGLSPENGLQHTIGSTFKVRLTHLRTPHTPPWTFVLSTLGWKQHGLCYTWPGGISTIVQSRKCIGVEPAKLSANRCNALHCPAFHCAPIHFTTPPRVPLHLAAASCTCLLSLQHVLVLAYSIHVGSTSHGSNIPQLLG